MTSVKNYYKMTMEEINKALKFVRDWLFDNPRSQHIPKMRFALGVIWDAKRVKPQLETDQFLRDVVDNLF